VGKLICNNKKYRTRDGQDVVIDRKRCAGWPYPVTGKLIRSSGKPVRLSWTEEGHYLKKSHQHLNLDGNPWLLDLVEV